MRCNSFLNKFAVFFFIADAVNTLVIGEYDRKERRIYFQEGARRTVKMDPVSTASERMFRLKWTSNKQGATKILLDDEMLFQTSAQTLTRKEVVSLASFPRSRTKRLKDKLNLSKNVVKKSAMDIRSGS